MSAHELLIDHPLAGVGLSALAAAEGAEGSADLQQFESAIRDYSLNRTGVDWALVERLGAVLAGQRCDLKIYSYLMLAAFSANAADPDGSPFMALGAGLHALADVIEKGWERCTPRLPARRQTQFKWLSEELASAVRSRPPRPAELPMLLACLEEAERVAELAGKALDLTYPLLRELREALAAHKPAPPVEPPPAPKPAVPPPPKVVPAPAPAPPAVIPPQPAPADTAPATPAATGGSERKEPVSPSSLSKEALEDSVAEFVTVLAAQLRAESLTDPASYWLLRALRWAGHDLLREERVREIVANKYRTVLPVPPDYKTLVRQFPARLAEGQLADVLAECEELFATYPLWLDLQRFTAIALDALGATTARHVVRSQVQLLLLRCPDVIGFRFSDRDETPFADSDTVQWLQAEQQLGRPESAASGQAASPQGISLSDELEPAVRELQKLIALAGAAQRRFELQLQLGELLLARQRSDIAMPIVEALLAASEAHRLAEWQPELYERALRLAVRAGRAAELPEPRRAALWSRLCQASPAAALSLGPESMSG